LSATVTDLLIDLQSGSEGAMERLIPIVYDELRSLAAAYLNPGQGSRTLQPTALVHEVYLKLVDQRRATYQNRTHFFGTAALLMRRLIVDHARREGTQKRGSGNIVTLSDDLTPGISTSDDVIRLNDALDALAVLDTRQARVVECRFFGGLSIDETADVLEISPATVKREWTMARAWLHAELQG
jgi:RNA polymerase sigma-70 factor, ECF subfamily